MADNNEALPVLGWLIQYSRKGYVRHTVSGHNCVADYRDADPGATSTELTSLPAATAALSKLRAEVERLTHKLKTVKREASEYYRRGPKIGSVLMRHELHDEALQIISHGISSSGAIVIIVASNKHDAARSAASGESAEGGV